MEQIPQDPYIQFLQTVRRVRTDIGENMSGFILMFCTKKSHHPEKKQFPEIKDDQPLFTWVVGGPTSVTDTAYLELATNLLERFISSNRGNLYIAAESMKARLLQKLMERERKRRP